MYEKALRQVAFRRAVQSDFSGRISIETLVARQPFVFLICYHTYTVKIIQTQLRNPQLELYVHSPASLLANLLFC